MMMVKLYISKVVDYEFSDILDEFSQIQELSPFSQRVES